MPKEVERIRNKGTPQEKSPKEERGFAKSQNKGQQQKMKQILRKQNPPKKHTGTNSKKAKMTIEEV